MTVVLWILCHAAVDTDIFYEAPTAFNAGLAINTRRLLVPFVLIMIHVSANQDIMAQDISTHDMMTSVLLALRPMDALSVTLAMRIPPLLD